MASINVMVQRVAGLQDTGDLSDWEEDFVASVVERSNNGENTTTLTTRQVEVLERLFKKHFAG